MIEGSCHCGTVRWTFEGQPDGATACNCTVCRRYGVLWAYDYEGEGIRISGWTRSRTFRETVDVSPITGSSGKDRVMPAYLIAEHIITDAAKFDEYRTRVAPMMAKYGARYLTKGGSHQLPEGGHWQPERVVIIEFPDMNALNAWYHSAEYQPLIALRKTCTSDLDMLFILEGA